MLTVIVLVRKPSLRSPTNITILFLSMTDILMALLVMPFSLVSFIRGRWSFSKFACTLNAYWIGVLLGASLVTMTCTAIARYIRLMRPFVHRYMKGKTTIVILSTLWLMTLILTAIPVVVDSGQGIYYVTRCFCRLQYRNKTVYWKIDIVRVALSGLMVITIFLAYYKVFRFVSRHNQSVGSTLQQGRHLHVEEIKITRTLAIVVFGFVACWIPTGVIEALDIVCRALGTNVPAFVIFQRTLFMFASCAINPFIYGFTNRSLRKGFWQLLRCHQQSCRQVLPT